MMKLKMQLRIEFELTIFSTVLQYHCLIHIFLITMSRVHVGLTTTSLLLNLPAADCATLFSGISLHR